MSTTIMARAPFSTAAFAQLVERLRHTSARYHQLAREFRLCRASPKHHAKRRACRAGLRVKIEKLKYRLPALDPSPAHQDSAYIHPHPRRITLRLPLLKDKLNLDYPTADSLPGPLNVPGAPKLLPRQLPDDECGMDDMMLASASSPSNYSSSDGSDALLTPFDVRVSQASGLCITIPPRSLKRKLQDVEPDHNTEYRQHKISK